MLNLIKSLTNPHKFVIKIIGFFFFVILYSKFLTKVTSPEDYFIISEEKDEPFEHNMRHFCVTTFTTTGYGDIVPVTKKSRMYSQILMFCAFVIVIL